MGTLGEYLWTYYKTLYKTASVRSIHTLQWCGICYRKASHWWGYSISHELCTRSMLFRFVVTHTLRGYFMDIDHQCQWGNPEESEWNDDVIKWKHFPRYWPFVRGIHRSPVNSPHKGQWRGALMFTLICAQINGWENNRAAGDLRHHRAHYDVIVMESINNCWRNQYEPLALISNETQCHSS